MTEAQDISGQAGDAGAKQRLSLDGNSNERKLTSRSLLFGESVSPSSLFSSSSSPHAGVYARNIDLKHELRVVSEHLKGSSLAAGSNYGLRLSALTGLACFLFFGAKVWILWKLSLQTLQLEPAPSCCTIRFQ